MITSISSLYDSYTLFMHTVNHFQCNLLCCVGYHLSTHIQHSEIYYNVTSSLCHPVFGLTIKSCVGVCIMYPNCSWTLYQALHGSFGTMRPIIILLVCYIDYTCSHNQEQWDFVDQSLNSECHLNSS